MFEWNRLAELAYRMGIEEGKRQCPRLPMIMRPSLEDDYPGDKEYDWEMIWERRDNGRTL